MYELTHSFFFLSSENVRNPKLKLGKMDFKP